MPAHKENGLRNVSEPIFSKAGDGKRKPTQRLEIRLGKEV